MTTRHDLNILIQELSEFSSMAFLKKSFVILDALKTCLDKGNSSPITSKLSASFKKNHFHVNDSETIELSSQQCIDLFETLIKHDYDQINIIYKDLKDKIEASVQLIFESTNNQISLLKAMEINNDILVQNLLDFITNTMRPSSMIKNKSKVPLFTLTKLCHSLGSLCIDIYMKNHNILFIRNAATSGDRKLSYNNFIRIIASEKLAKNNKLFQEILGVKFKKVKMKPTVIYTTKEKETYHTVSAFQRFYTLLRTHLLATEESFKDLPNIIKIKETDMKLKIKLGSVIVHSLIKTNVFIEELLQKKTMKNLVLTLNEKIYQGNETNVNSQRPYFAYKTIENLYNKYKRYTALNDENLMVFTTCSYRKQAKIHPNLSMELNPNRKNTLSKDPNFTGKKYLKNLENYTSFVGSIDINYLYNFFLLLKKHFLETKSNIKFSFEKMLKRHENIFVLYKINIKDLSNLYYENTSNIKRLIEHFFEYALNFNQQDNKYLLKEITYNLRPLTPYTKGSIEWSNYYHLKRQLIEFYNKVYSMKLFLREFFIECFIYSHFDYFINDCFLDTRGRHYLNGFYLNPQGYPIVKAFIKPFVYENNDVFKKYRNIIDNLVPSKVIESQNIMTLIEENLDTYDKYILVDSNLKVKYLYNLLDNKNITFVIFNEILQILKKRKLDFEILFIKTLTLIKKYMRDKKKLFTLHSEVLLYLYPQKYKDLYYELDATASGLQMTASVLRDRDLAELCNLTGEGNNDIYKLFSTETIETIQYLLTSFDSIEIPLNIISMININYDSSKYLYNSVFNNKNKYIQLKKNFIEIITWHSFETLINFIDQLQKTSSWIITEKFPTKDSLFVRIIDEIRIELNLNIESSKMIKNMYNLIYIVGGTLKFKKLKENNFPWLLEWLEDRKTFKNAIMTFGYNATPYRRKEVFMNNLLEKSKTSLILDLLFIVQIIENLFQKLKDKYLRSSQILGNFGKILTKDPNDPQLDIIINNGLFTIKLKSYKKREYRLPVTGLDTKRWHQLTLQFTRYKNNKELMTLIPERANALLARKFAANFIHTMDAWLVCLFKYKIANFNSIFKGKFFINNLTNHDTFSMTLTPFLKYILMDVYTSLYSLNYIQTLQGNTAYNNLLYTWYSEILHSDKVRKLTSCSKQRLAKIDTLVCTLPDGNQVKLGTTDSISLNPYFVK